MTRKSPSLRAHDGWGKDYHHHVNDFRGQPDPDGSAGCFIPRGAFCLRVLAREKRFAAQSQEDLGPDVNHSFISCDALWTTQELWR